MERMKGVALAVVLSALTCSSPGAEELQHHGEPADSEGNVSACLGCHDGNSASRKLGGFHHPVNRDYPPARNAASFQPPDSVTAAGIKLPHGQVTCISCHNLKNPETAHLVVPLDNSNLCFNCHNI